MTFYNIFKLGYNKHNCQKNKSFHFTSIYCNIFFYFYHNIVCKSIVCELGLYQPAYYVGSKVIFISGDHCILEFIGFHLMIINEHWKKLFYNSFYFVELTQLILVFRLRVSEMSRSDWDGISDERSQMFGLRIRKSSTDRSERSRFGLALLAMQTQVLWRHLYLHVFFDELCLGSIF